MSAYIAFGLGWLVLSIALALIVGRALRLNEQPFHIADRPAAPLDARDWWGDR